MGCHQNHGGGWLFCGKHVSVSVCLVHAEALVCLPENSSVLNNILHVFPYVSNKNTCVYTYFKLLDDSFGDP